MSTLLKEIIQETNKGKRETIAKEYMETLQSRKEIAQKYDIHADSVSNYVNEFYPSMKWRINYETGEFSKVLNRAEQDALRDAKRKAHQLNKGAR